MVGGFGVVGVFLGRPLLNVDHRANDCVAELWLDHQLSRNWYRWLQRGSRLPQMLPDLPSLFPILLCPQSILALHDIDVLVAVDVPVNGVATQ